MTHRATSGWYGLIAVATLLTAHAAAGAATVYTGNIMSAAQYDLYTVTLTAGELVTATLVCDEESPGVRPLDPVLSAFLPGVDPSDTSNANFYNDDGFGSDDAPNAGVDCAAFQSSRIRFVAPVDGVYTFRADGFGSATGPYTLAILVGPPVGAPALGELGIVLGVLILAAVALLQFRRSRA